MPYVLALIIMFMGVAGVYGYRAMQQQERHDLEVATDKLNTEVEHLKNENARLQAKLTELQSHPAPAPAPVAVTPTPLPAVTPNPTPTPALFAPPANVFSTDLGTFTTDDGKVYEKAKLLKVNQLGIVISATSGITEIAYMHLPPALQKQLGFDPGLGTELSETQVTALQAKIQAASGR